MGIPIKSLTQSQRFWYAQMVLAAVLADNEITQPETEFIKQIIQVVTKPEEKQELMNRITSKRAPSIYRASGAPPKLLAAVFIELSLVLISDVDFSPEERAFLEEVARVFRFTETYYQDLMVWCEEGLAWKTEQLRLTSAESGVDDLGVPYTDLSPDQQQWYAEVLIASIMSDQKLDASEVSFLMNALNMIPDETRRRKMTQQIRLKKTPNLVEPPNMSQNVLVRIFMEVMLIITADESLDLQEEAFLKQLSCTCNFPIELSDQLLMWCHRGIRWKRAKNPLIPRCRIETGNGKGPLLRFSRDEMPNITKSFSADEEPDGADFTVTEKATGSLHVPEEPGQNESQAIKQEEPIDNDSVATDVDTGQLNSLNNSIIDYNKGCFVCGQKRSAKYFHLDPHSQKPKHNIFGIPIYQISADGFDPIDYNQCKVTICSNCFFASTQKQLFKSKSSSPLPGVLSPPDFKKLWLQDTDSKRVMFKERINEISSIDRSLATVVNSYQLAIDASTRLANLNESFELSWHTITLKLTLAEVLMSHGKKNSAERLLKQIQKRSLGLFKTVKNNFVTFRSARLILLIAIYFGDATTIERFYTFFHNFKTKRFDNLEKGDQQLFKRVIGEVNRVVVDAAGYRREKLDGFLKSSLIEMETE